MFYKPIELAQRYHEITNQLDSLMKLYGDFKTLNAYRSNERGAIKDLVGDLNEEKSSIEKALNTLEMVKL